MSSPNKEESKETTKILEAIKKAPLEKSSIEQKRNNREELKMDNSPLGTHEKDNPIFIKNQTCNSLLVSIVLNSQVNHSEELNAGSKNCIAEEIPIQEDIKGEENEELHESNYSNRSHLDSTDKAKIVGSRIAFINNGSYI